MEYASNFNEITDWYVLAGGTAISAFYLHHRKSEDLDFFTENDVNLTKINEIIDKIAKELKMEVKSEPHSGMYIYRLRSEVEILKIDIVNMPFKMLEKPTIKFNDKIKITSIWDILVDKLYTIFHRQHARDFVDLYFGMQSVGCDIKQLKAAMEEKYEMEFDELALISRLPCVKDVSDFPKMIVPFDRKKMEDFFLNIVKSLEKEIFI